MTKTQRRKFIKFCNNTGLKGKQAMEAFKQLK